MFIVTLETVLKKTLINWFFSLCYCYSGSVQVFYLVGLGSLAALDGNTILAKPNVSFIPVAQASQTFRNGENQSQISVNIMDDGYPRPNQVFLVNLTQVQLLQPASSAFVPRLGNFGNNCLSCILS